MVEPSIKNETECSEYKFEEAEDINANIHTVEKSLCILTNSSNQLVRYNDNSIIQVFLCKVRINNIDPLYVQRIYNI